MDYKILYIKNNYFKKLKFKKGLDFFKKNTPLNIITEEINTNWKLEFSKDDAGNSKYKGCYVSESIYEKIRAIVPRYKYHEVCLIYDEPGPRVRMNVAMPYPIYPETDFCQVVNLKDGGKKFNHETFHCFIYKANRLGANIIDPMDSYILDENFKVDSIVNTNRELALLRLKPHWDKVCYLGEEKKKTEYNKTKTYNLLKDKKQDNFPQYLVLHHSGGMVDTSNQTPEIIENYHLSLGWEGIGYHYLIDKGGNISYGRPEKYHGSHVKGLNTKSIGICVIGNFDLTLPTEAQKKSLILLTKDILSRYPNLKKVYHRNFADKTCPGSNIADNWYDKLMM